MLERVDRHNTGDQPAHGRSKEDNANDRRNPQCCPHASESGQQIRLQRDLGGRSERGACRGDEASQVQYKANHDEGEVEETQHSVAKHGKTSAGLTAFPALLSQVGQKQDE